MDNEVLINTRIDVDYAKAERELAALQKKIENTTRKRTVLVELKIQAAQKAQDVRTQLETERKKLESMQGDLKYASQVGAQEELVARLEAEYAKLIKEVEKYGDAINKSTTEIDVMEDEAKKLAATLADAKPAETQEKNADAMRKGARDSSILGESIGKFITKLKNLVKASFVFSIISKGLSMVKEWFSSVIQANDATALAFANLKGSLMTLVQPLINVVIPIIQRALAVLTQIVSFLSTIFSALFGSTLSASAASASALNDSINGTADGLGAANDNAKKLKRTLAGFDEIETLTSPDTGGGGGGGGGGGASVPTAAFDFAGLDFSDFFDASELEALREVGEAVGQLFRDIWGTIKEIVGLVVEWAKELDFTPLLTAIKGLLEAIWKVLEPIFEIIKIIWQKLLAPILKKLVEDWLPKIIDTISLILEALGELITALEPIIEAIMEIIEPLAEIVGDIITLVIQIVGSGLSEVIKVIAKVLEKVTPILKTIASVLGPIIRVLEPVIEIIMELVSVLNDSLLFVLKLIIDILTGDFQAVKQDVNGFIQKLMGHLEKFRELFQKLEAALNTAWEAISTAAKKALDAITNAVKTALDFIMGIWATVKQWFLDNVITPIGEAFKAAWDFISGIFKNAWEGIKNVWNVVSSWFQNNIINPVRNAFTTAWNTITGAVNGAWNAIKGVWQSVSSWFQNNIINPVVNAWNTATSKISGFFSSLWYGIKSGVVNAMNGAIAGIETAINWIVDGINGILGGVNKVVGAISKAFGGSGGGIGLLNRVYLGRVPLLAQGAVVPPNNPFLATLGDNTKETEIVSPLSTMKQAVLEALSEANFNGDIKVYLDGRQISASVTKYQLQTNRALGV